MTSTTDTSPRSADIEFLFEALNYATAPLTINVALLGAAKMAKPNTLAKRISTIAKRCNLNITSTTKGEGNAPTTPGKPRTVATRTPASRKRKVKAKVKKESDEEEDEVEMNDKQSDGAEHGGKKQKTSNGCAGHEDEDACIAVDGEDVAEEELA